MKAQLAMLDEPTLPDPFQQLLTRTLKKPSMKILEEVVLEEDSDKNYQYPFSPLCMYHIPL